MDLALSQQNIALQHNLSILTFQMMLLSIASSHYIYHVSLNWWAKDLAQLEPKSLFELWVNALEIAYSELLGTEKIQQSIGEIINRAVWEYGSGVSRM